MVCCLLSSLSSRISQYLSDAILTLYQRYWALTAHLTFSVEHHWVLADCENWASSPLLSGLNP